jgi:16S rRNA (uracil1498-N3)-methyltransferase
MTAVPCATLPWLLVEGSELDAGRPLLDGDETRHLKGALRRRVGDRVALTDGCGRVAEAVFVALENDRASCEIVCRHEVPEPAWAGITVGLAVLHGRAMDWAVQKAVEVGATSLVPVLAQRSQLDRKAAAGRRPHWQRVARQALKQCHRCWAMEVSEPCGVEDFVLDRPGGLVASGDGDPLERCSGNQGDRVLLVGPEGGFSDRERQLLDRADGWRRLRLGPYVLRAETAVVLGVGMLVAHAERQVQGLEQEGGGP